MKKEFSAGYGTKNDQRAFMRQVIGGDSKATVLQQCCPTDDDWALCDLNI